MGRGGGGGDRELRGAEWRGGYLRLLFVWLVSWCPGALCGLYYYTTRDDHRVAIHPSKSVSFSGFSGCTSNKENPSFAACCMGECRLELFGSYFIGGSGAVSLSRPRTCAEARLANHERAQSVTCCQPVRTRARPPGSSAPTRAMSLPESCASHFASPLLWPHS